MLILIRGAGDLASGVALRLHRSGLKVVMTALEKPTAIRRTVCFSQAILFGKAKVEDVTAVRAETMDDVRRILAAGNIPVLADPAAECRQGLRTRIRRARAAALRASARCVRRMTACFISCMRSATSWRPERRSVR